jgi:hypothetical protein
MMDIVIIRSFLDFYFKNSFLRKGCLFLLKGPLFKNTVSLKVISIYANFIAATLQHFGILYST